MIFTAEEIYSLNALNESEQSVVGISPTFMEDSTGELLGEALVTGYRELSDREFIENDTPQKDCIDYGFILESYQKAKRYLKIDKTFLAIDVDKEKLFTIMMSEISENQYNLTRESKFLLFSMFLAELNDFFVEKETINTEQNIVLAKERLVYLYSDCKMIELTYFEYNECTYSALIINTDEGILEYDIFKEEASFIEAIDFKKKLIKMMKVVI